ncbi:serine protease inhibitor 88Ea-like isoform X2 [Chelonus insularis]|uniref:serine protease inhibitor 88Ea-like isoform X2 n=1 Tax=Chelonus insularis TaxID=460826 RepID=UPI00158ED38A|nr:serine protease inhibitor 88Ea-like isoform X2 [Chelonus insularis]
MKLKAISALSLLLIGSVLEGTLAQCITDNDAAGAIAPDTNELMVKGKISFALDALKEAALIESEDNLFFSPHSLYEALTLAYFGARGTTEESLKRALRIPESLSKRDVWGNYIIEKSFKLMNISTDYEFNTANRLWISDKKKIRECMLDFFGSELQQMDFKANPEGARNQINEWVSNITKGHIQDLLATDAIAEDTDLVLTNAVYFKGLWAQKFDPASSARAIFFGSKDSLVTFMNQKGSFSFTVSEDLGAHVIELPYKGNTISMFVFLPPFVTNKMQRDLTANERNKNRINQLIERMTNTEKGIEELYGILQRGMLEREVRLSIPKFSIEKELPVTQLFHALGAGEILTPGRADLRGFLSSAEDNLHLGDAVHRAKIDLTEEGTTASGATAILSFRSSRPTEPVTFNANHPFVYLIYDKQSRSIIFTGIYRTPTSPGAAA